MSAHDSLSPIVSAPGQPPAATADASATGGYSEASDIAQHREDIARMASMLANAGCSEYPSGGQFIKLLGAKMERNECALPIDRVEFHAGDAQKLI